MFSTNLRIAVFITAWTLCIDTFAQGPPQTFVEEFTGKVRAVQGRGGLKVVREDETVETITLYGIDCPGSLEAFGEETKRHVSSLVINLTVTVKVRRRSPTGRILGDVILPMEGNLAAKLVRDGFATWDKDEAPDWWGLAPGEQEAQEQRKGMWGSRYREGKPIRYDLAGEKGHIEEMVQASREFSDRKKAERAAEQQAQLDAWQRMSPAEQEATRAAWQRQQYAEEMRLRQEAYRPPPMPAPVQQQPFWPMEEQPWPMIEYPYEY